MDQLGEGPGGALGGRVGGEEGGELGVETGEGEVGLPDGGGAAAGVRLKEDGHGFGPGSVDGGRGWGRVPGSAPPRRARMAETRERSPAGGGSACRRAAAAYGACWGKALIRRPLVVLCPLGQGRRGCRGRRGRQGRR